MLLLFFSTKVSIASTWLSWINLPLIIRYWAPAKICFDLLKRKHWTDRPNSSIDRLVKLKVIFHYLLLKRLRYHLVLGLINCYFLTLFLFAAHYFTSLCNRSFNNLFNKLFLLSFTLNPPVNDFCIYFHCFFVIFLFAFLLTKY